MYVTSSFIVHILLYFLEACAFHPHDSSTVCRKLQYDNTYYINMHGAIIGNI